jgi:excisionase family DNA binding protein
MSNELKSYTPAELAEELKVPKRTVLRAIIRKELKAIRYSACTIRVLVSDAQKWINTLRK